MCVAYQMVKQSAWMEPIWDIIFLIVKETGVYALLSHFYVHKITPHIVHDLCFNRYCINLVSVAGQVEEEV